MSKKRLSDLVREEVVREASAAEVDIDIDSTTTTSSIANIAEIREETAELKAKVTELTAALEATLRREERLKSQVAALEAELKEQKDIVKTLSGKLEKAGEIEAGIEVSALEKSQKLSHKMDVLSAIEPRPVGGFTIPAQPSPQLSNEDIGWFD